MGDHPTRSPTPSRTFYGVAGRRKREAPPHVYKILPPAEAALFELIKQQSHIQHPDKSRGIRFRIKLSIRKAATLTGLSRETMRTAAKNLRGWKMVDRLTSPDGTYQYIIRPYLHWEKRVISEVTSENPRKRSKPKDKSEAKTRRPTKSTKVKGNQTRPVQTAPVSSFQVPRMRPLPTPSISSLLGHINRHFNPKTPANCAPEWKTVPARREHAEWVAGKTGVHAVVNSRICPEPCIIFGEFDKLCTSIATKTREASEDQTMDAGLLERKPKGLDHNYSAARVATLTYYVRSWLASKENDSWSRKKDAKYWVLAAIEANLERNIKRREQGKRPFFSASTVFQFSQDPVTKRRTVFDESHLVRDDTVRKMAAAYRSRINARWQTQGRHQAETEKRKAAEAARAAAVLPPELSLDRCRGILVGLKALKNPAPRLVPVQNPPRSLKLNLVDKNLKVVVSKVLPLVTSIPPGVGKAPAGRHLHLVETRPRHLPDNAFKSALEITTGPLGRGAIDQGSLQRHDVEKRTPSTPVDAEAWRRHLDRQRTLILARAGTNHDLPPFKKGSDT